MRGETGCFLFVLFVFSLVIFSCNITAANEKMTKSINDATGKMIKCDIHYKYKDDTEKHIAMLIDNYQSRGCFGQLEKFVNVDDIVWYKIKETDWLGRTENSMGSKN
jgi:competence protein ComGC